MNFISRSLRNSFSTLFPTLPCCRYIYYSLRGSVRFLLARNLKCRWAARLRSTPPLPPINFISLLLLLLLGSCFHPFLSLPLFHERRRTLSKRCSLVSIQRTDKSISCQQYISSSLSKWIFIFLPAESTLQLLFSPLQCILLLRLSNSPTYFPFGEVSSLTLEEREILSRESHENSPLLSPSPGIRRIP